MSTNKTKRIFIILFIAAVAFALTLLSKMSLAANSSTSVVSETETQIIAQVVVNHEDGDIEQITQFTSRYTAYADGRELYCVQHGVSFHSSDETLDINTALTYGDTNGSKVAWPVTYNYCREFEYEGEITYPVLYCTGSHYNLEGSDPDLAYILTYPPLGTWTEEKQEAVWTTDFAGNRGNQDAATALTVEALRYEEWFNQTASVEGADVNNTSIAPEDLTDLDDIDVAVNYTDQTLVIGPFSIDYIYGAYDDIGVAFGGISDMYFIGYNSSGEVVQERIEIYKYISEDVEYDLEFFEPDDSYVDYTDQVYPKGVSGGEDVFYLKIENPNASATGDDDSVAELSLHIEFQWMSAEAYLCVMDAHKYTVTWTDSHTWYCNGHTATDSDGETYTYNCGGCRYKCTAYSWLEDSDIQDHGNVLEGKRKLYQASLDIPATDGPDKINITMELGGVVWEDAVTTKESKADGVNNTDGDVDIRLKNVKVTLYDEDGNIVELLTDEDADDVDDTELMHRINPTYTDENGEYLFRGLDPLKKYYVVFEYNGQRYLPTEYLNTADGQYSSVEQMVNAELYNTTEWEVSSKGTEAEGSSSIEGIEISRSEFDDRFSEITAYPENYPSSNSLGVVGDYNATFTQKDLMGYTLDEDGNYQKTETQLIDGYEFDEDGNETTTFSEGIISQKVREYISSNKKFPDETAMKQIYSDIAGNDTEMWRKLQFIEDCQIQAYTGSPFSTSYEIDYYPVYDQFYINNADDEDSGNVDYDTSELNIAGVTYKPIYPGQYYVNLGLWRRQEYDAAIRKDVFKAAIKINGKTLTYDYDKRADEDEESANSADGNDNNTYWDISVRMSDYDNYYGIGYNRDIYEEDYEFKTEGSSTSTHVGDALEVYVTYQISVTNQSMSIETQIRELVDYYDADYTFKPNLSWVTFQYYKNTSKVVTNNYYSMMDNPQSTIDDDSNNLALQYMAYDDSDELIAVTAENANRSSTNKDLGSEYNNLYIHPIEDIKLETGETAYIYLTFQVNKDSDGHIIVDDDDTPKRNIVEINGYTTFYRDGTTLPNGVEKDSDDVAGLLDRDSNPGNLVAEDLQGDKYEKNFEDDTDEAPPLTITVDADDIRQVNGYVWEDERTESSGDALIGNGIREDGEEDVEGVIVQLIELCSDGSEWLWYTTTTGANGYYEFAEGFIPGDYIVRFIYGSEDGTALSTDSEYYQGYNIVSYNGQDFKSTTYQGGITQEGTTDIDGTYSAYTDTSTQNESYTYGYDIYAADQETDAGNNYSDAKDIWSRREAVISYSDTDVTNHIAEVLASPYQVPEYNDTAYTEDEMRALYDELEANTYMIAETGVIVMEVEYNRQTTDGYDSVQNNADTSTQDYYKDENDQNGNYVVKNVDFGLEERPKSQLEIDKSVANIRVTLANNNILFDINSEANNALWTDHQEYNIGAVKEDNDGIYPTYYDTEDKHRYSYREVIDTIVSGTDKGLIQLTMDEELMHGATVQITYAVKITNVGETDYVDGTYKDFYYLGQLIDAQISTTTANQVIDYVQNNLRFDESAQANAYNALNGVEETEAKTNTENGWAVIEKTTITDSGLVNSYLSTNLENFIDIIETESFGEQALTPGDSITKTLILSQEITSENTADDLTYGNMVEIVMTSNDVGRRMAYSVVGNQDPTDNDAGEVDANVAERVVILPPFGEDRFFYLIGFVIGAILITGIVLIRRKVLGNSDDKPEPQE